MDNNNFNNQEQQNKKQNSFYQADNDNLEEPVSFSDWMVTILLAHIPCVNLIMLFGWMYGTKKSKSNYSKAMLVWMLIYFVMVILIITIFSPLIVSVFRFY